MLKQTAFFVPILFLPCKQELIEALAKVGLACREGTGTPGQWLHCLAVGGMALASLPDLRSWRGLAMEPQEALNCLILPGVSLRQPMMQSRGDWP